MAPYGEYVRSLFLIFQIYLTFDRLARIGLQGVSAASHKARQRARRRVSNIMFLNPNDPSVLILFVACCSIQ